MTWKLYDAEGLRQIIKDNTTTYGGFDDRKDFSREEGWHEVFVGLYRLEIDNSLADFYWTGNCGSFETSIPEIAARVEQAEKTYLGSVPFYDKAALLRPDTQED